MHAIFDPVFDQLPGILLLIFGFGFVIFWHELGHFLAAKWAGVRVEQFAVGFGQAILSWRKGIGFRFGSSRQEYERLAREYIETQKGLRAENGPVDADLDDQKLNYAASKLGLGDTEYRLNWIPLGGYVKMLGQDDLNPNAVVNDPRAYNMKPISKRMVIVSAGVIMNVILAIIGFSVLFRIGFDVPPPVVGMVYPNSPAQRAGVEVGDRVLKFDDKVQRDFTKIQLNVALVKEGESVPLVVQKPDGSTKELHITAERSAIDNSGFLQVGMTASPELRGLDARQAHELGLSQDEMTVKPGEKIIAVEGEPLRVGGREDEYWKLDQAAQRSQGKPLTITIEQPDGKTRQAHVQPRFLEIFNGPLAFAGMAPRATVRSVEANSSAKGKLQDGDAVVSMTVKPVNDTLHNPDLEHLREALSKAGAAGATVDMVVLRDGKEVEVNGLTPNVKLPNKSKGLGISLGVDAEHPLVGGVVPDSPAAAARLPVGESGGTLITKIADQPVNNCYDIRRVLAEQSPGAVPVSYKFDGQSEKTVSLQLSAADISSVKSTRYIVDLDLHGRTEPRQTNNPLIAVGWGLEETRDLIVQFYITLQRMVVSHSISYKQAMGPVGIFRAGTTFAARGTDWLIWFLSMISANLAVVNFLPIPIVDGGLFTFLIIEKIQGRPLSPRVQSIAQVVGLALILSVFILVTIQDITR